MKRDSRGRFAPRTEPQPELEGVRVEAMDATRQKLWRARNSELCIQCAKRPKAPGLSRCGECMFGEDNPKGEDLVDVLNPEPGEPSRMRSWRKMSKANRPE